MGRCPESMTCLNRYLDVAQRIAIWWQPPLPKCQFSNFILKLQLNSTLRSAFGAHMNSSNCSWPAAYEIMVLSKWTCQYFLLKLIYFSWSNRVRFFGDGMQTLNSSVWDGHFVLCIANGCCHSCSISSFLSLLIGCIQFLDGIFYLYYSPLGLSAIYLSCVNSFFRWLNHLPLKGGSPSLAVTLPCNDQDTFLMIAILSRSSYYLVFEQIYKQDWLDLWQDLRLFELPTLHVSLCIHTGLWHWVVILYALLL